MTKKISRKKDGKSKRVKLDIDFISERSYGAIVRAFWEQHGKGYYGEWKITAVKEEE